MRVRLWRQDVAIHTPIQAAGQCHDRRGRLFLAVEFHDVTGYGEVAPQPEPLHGDPGIVDVINEVQAYVLPQLRRIVDREGELPSWSRVARLAGPRPASAQAVALVEMALLDREMCSMGCSILDVWPAKVVTPLQATVSLIDGASEWRVPEGVARVRVKTVPGALDVRSLERLSSLVVPVLLDFNCSATGDAEVIEQVEAVGRVARLSGVEQPFAPGNVIEHARLAEQLDVPVSIDEGVRSLRDIDQLVRYRAAQIVCVKPARVGGLANARTIIARAQEAGLRPYVGGFFESPYARRVHRHLANTGVSEPSDLSPVALDLLGYDHEVEPTRVSFGVRPSSEMLHEATLVALEGSMWI